ncbi:MAG: DUF1579 family protein [Thermoanaerobaculia bacterium]
MSKRTMVAALVLGMACSGLARAEDAAKPMEMPKPGPEHKKLGYFVGNWSTKGELKPGPMGAGGKMSGMDSCSWFEGGYAVVCKSTGKSPMGPMKGMGIMSYSTEDKVYTYFGIDNMGMGDYAKGHVDNDVWTYSNESKFGGKTYKGRYTMSGIKPDSYSFKWELSEDGTTWMTMMEGKTTRQKKAAAAKSDMKS